MYSGKEGAAIFCRAIWMEVESRCEPIDTADVLVALFSEFSGVIDYATLRDTLPRRLTALLRCRCVLLYQSAGETLQFAAGSFDDRPGWSAALLAVAHINPISVSADLPEARAWRERRCVGLPAVQPTLLAIPLLYRHRCIGVLVVLRGRDEEEDVRVACWHEEELPVLEAIAGTVALLLENARLLERDRERIHKLSLLNSMSNQLGYTLHDRERLRRIMIQRTREICGADLCELLDATATEAAEWITPALRAALFRHFQARATAAPLIIEQAGESDDPACRECLTYLPSYIKTFFAYPLLAGRGSDREHTLLLRREQDEERERGKQKAFPPVLGIVVGAYCQTWKLRRAEMVLLRVLASQAGTVLENMHLVEEVIKARDEARRLLRKVLDDQRLKELILESTPGGLLTTDLEGRITMFNRAAQVILGYRADQALGQPLDRLLDLRPLAGAESALDRPLAMTTHDWRREIDSTPDSLPEARSGSVVMRDRRGREIVLDVAVLPLRDEPGRRIGLLVSFADVTTVRRLEEEKRRLDRLASLGEMAANVAHEVRNPLASIKTSMQMLRDDLAACPSAQELDETQESISVVLKEVERLDSIVHDLLLFARPRHLHRVRCDPVELCERVLKMLQVQCDAASIKVSRLYEQVPLIQVDIAQLEQILLNLLMNAIQAMPGGGTLTIVCRAISAAQALAQEGGEGADEARVQGDEERGVKHGDRMDSARAEGAFWVEIAIGDTGEGVSPEHRERIFQPFFTTRAHGIGLGLPITRRLIEDHGGYIQVESQPGAGTTMIVRLPAGQ
ncbi:MAG: PAS domain S-box protein [Ktedonobacteraceae bacterium]|nr:PAS domain S-box protein [Ktedonobacteraceae bacterium]